MPWSSLRCWTTFVKKFGNKIESQIYFFQTSSSGANFYICQLPESLEMRKILAHGIRMQKNRQTRRTCYGFSRILMKLCGSNLHPRTEIKSMASLTPKLSIEKVNFAQMVAMAADGSIKCDAQVSTPKSPLYNFISAFCLSLVFIKETREFTKSFLKIYVFSLWFESNWSVKAIFSGFLGVKLIFLFTQGTD